MSNTNRTNGNEMLGVAFLLLVFSLVSGVSWVFGLDRAAIPALLTLALGGILLILHYTRD